jgi:RNA polymerase sigma factor (sigma-70 family)
VSSSTWWSNLVAEDILRLRGRLDDSLSASFPAVSQSDREDIVQQAFVALLQRRDEVDAANDGLYRYMHVAAQHLALDRLKAGYRSAEPLPPDLPQAESTSHFTAPGEIRDEGEKIRRIFYELGPVDRLVLWRHVVDGRSVQAIARELGLNWHQADQLLKRILAEVRRQMNPVDK